MDLETPAPPPQPPSQHIVWTHFIHEFCILPGSLQADFQAVEEELDKLQNICEEEALEREKESHMTQLAVYKKKKEAEAFSVKGGLVVDWTFCERYIFFHYILDDE